MPVRAVAALFGALFGFLISWGQFSDPDRIRDMLLLRDPYLYLMMFSAIAVASTGTWLLRRRRAHALVTGERISVERTRPDGGTSSARRSSASAGLSSTRAPPRSLRSSRRACGGA
jgi:hypothetical protein